MSQLGQPPQNDSALFGCSVGPPLVHESHEVVQLARNAMATKMYFSMAVGRVLQVIQQRHDVHGDPKKSSGMSRGDLAFMKKARGPDASRSPSTSE